MCSIFLVSTFSETQNVNSINMIGFHNAYQNFLQLSKEPCSPANMECFLLDTNAEVCLKINNNSFMLPTFVISHLV